MPRINDEMKSNDYLESIQKYVRVQQLT